MSVMEGTQTPRHVSAREQYLRIHKRLVGPKTAERLFLLYGDLASSSHSSNQHMAGWAAAEAALVATDRSKRDRLMMLGAAEEAWRKALTTTKKRSIERSETPNRSAEFRIRTDAVFLPVMESLIENRFDHATRIRTFDALLALGIENTMEMHDAELRGDKMMFSNYFGLAHEQTTLLAGNRLLSGRVLLMPSLARSGTGNNYPSQTHDVQVVNLRLGKFTNITPLEVKAEKIPPKYALPVMSARRHLKTGTTEAIARLYEAYARERENTASPEDLALAQASTDTVFHLVTHYYRAAQLGKHCVEIEKCTEHESRTLQSALS